MEVGRPASIRLDARDSPAQALPVSMIESLRSGHRSRFSGSTNASACDDALRWLMASDRVVSDRAARALLAVKTAKLHVKEGHARWTTYLRAFVPMTPRWCQQELRRIQALDQYPLLSAAWNDGSLSRSHLRALLRVVRPDTEAAWVERVKGLTVRQIEEFAVFERAREASGRAHGEQCTLDDASRGEGSHAATDEDRPRRRVVMAPPGVAVLVARAVELARKVDGYQIAAGQAVAMMAAETIAGLHECPVPADDEDAVGPHATTSHDPGGAADGRDLHSMGGKARSLLWDQLELARELGPGWQEVHRHCEEARKM